MPYTNRIIFCLLLLFSFFSVAAQDQEPPTEEEVVEAAVTVSTLETLESFVSLKADLEKDIKTLNRQLAKSATEAEKVSLGQQIEKLETDLRSTTRNMENIAAGVDITRLREQEKVAFNFQQEVLALLKPALDEMKEMTAHVRQKSDLRERIAFYEVRLPIIEKALENIARLQEESKAKTLKGALKAIAENWRKQQALMDSELQAAQLQLDKLVAAETSLAQASQSYLKNFFQKRGLYLTEALALVLFIILLSRLSHRFMERYIPGFRRQHRSFRIRLLELAHRIFTLLLVILGPMLVFYLVEDWVLFSLGILLLLGIAWTLRQTLPRYWSQIQLFLNIGSVREGERIQLEGLPWQVQQINVFCTLVNPVAEISQRIPIDELVDLKSRPSVADEPWFPCRKGDWVMLGDGRRGKVVGLSHELVQLVERGGSLLTLQTGEFLAAAPRNLSISFRLKEVIGISYSLQKASTGPIPETLQQYIQRRIAEEGYGEQLLNLRVEFAEAGNSSLNLVVIADFSGELADIYNRLRRSIQRWCVDACSENGWEIPFPQLTLHGSLS